MKKILLVDDIDVDRMLIRLALDRCRPEFRVIIAYSSAEAYHLIKQQNFDLILLDLNMPLMGGLELLERLHFGGSKIPPCIIVSGSSRKVDRHLAIALGATDYIHKTVDYSIFKGELTAALERNGFR